MLAVEKMMEEEEIEVGRKLDVGNVQGLLRLVGSRVKEIDTGRL